MKIGDVYYEKHTVVGISKRTGEVSETEIEEVKVLPFDVIDKIRAKIANLEEGISSYHNDRPWVFKDEVLQIIDKYRESEE